MKVIIVGAGNVGLASAKAALAGNDVYIIEKDVTVAEFAKSVLPVSILKSDASNPNVLRDAMARIKPDVVLSAVKDDGINIFICMNTKRIDNTVRTMACIRDPEFLGTEGYVGVDVLISPDTISADKMIKTAMLENAVNYEALDIENYCLTTFKIEKGHDIVGKTLMNTTLPANCTIIAIYRGDRTITTIPTTEVHAEDRIIVLGTWEATLEFNRLVGIKKEAKEFIILGAGHQGLTIAKQIADMGSNRFVKVLDNDMELCREAAKRLRNAIVVNGNVVDPQFLRSENIDRADAIISVTDVDERNLLTCMTASRFGIRKIISRYSIEEYEGIFKYAGIESVIGYHKIITNEVTKNLQSTEDYTIHVMDQPGDYFLTFNIDSNTPLTGKFYGDIVMPEGVNICALRRKDRITFPDMLTKFEEGDKVMLFTHKVDSINLAKILGKKTPEL